MKRILILLLAVIGYATSCHAQYEEPYKGYGLKNKRNVSTVTFLFPTGCGAPAAMTSTSAISDMAGKYYDSCNAKEYTWDPKVKTWTVGGSGLDTTVADARYVKKVDTAAMLTNYLRKTDTAVMLANYLRKSDTALMLANRLKVSDTTSMLAEYLRKSDTAYMMASRLKTSDTAFMLASYLRKSDTALMLANRLKVSDTTAMLANLLRKSDTAMMLVNYLRKTDTSGMLSGYGRSGHVVKYSDTTTMLSGYARTGNVPSNSTVVKYTDTASMLSGYSRTGQVVKYSDTTGMLSGYARSGNVPSNSSVVKYTDTSSMLSGYGRSGQIVKYSDTASMHANLLRKSDTSQMLSPYAKFSHIVKYYDTAAMLSNYLRTSNYPAANTLVKYTDTAAMHTNLLRKSDTSQMLSPYLRTSNYPASNTLVKYTDTSTMLTTYAKFAHVVKYYDTLSMLANLSRKSDTAFMLSKYVRNITVNNGMTVSGNYSNNITLGLGDITPSSVAPTGGFTITGSNTASLQGKTWFNRMESLNQTGYINISIAKTDNTNGVMNLYNGGTQTTLAVTNVGGGYAADISNNSAFVPALVLTNPAGDALRLALGGLSIPSGGATITGAIKFSGLTSTADTTTFKPVVINSTGQIYKRTNWGPTGGTGGASSWRDYPFDATNNITVTEWNYGADTSLVIGPRGTGIYGLGPAVDPITGKKFKLYFRGDASGGDPVGFAFVDSARFAATGQVDGFMESYLDGSIILDCGLAGGTATGLNINPISAAAVAINGPLYVSQPTDIQNTLSALSISTGTITGNVLTLTGGNLTTNKDIVSAGQRIATRAVSGTYSVVDSDFFITAGTTSFTITLPTATGRNGKIFEIMNTGAGVITVASAGGLVNAGSSITLAIMTGKRFICDGTNWWAF